MVKKIITGAMIGATLLMTGCTYKNPAINNTVDISKVDMNTISSMKKGEACHSWFLIFPTGMDATVKEAAKDGRINHVKYVEYTDSNYLIAGSHCVVVYGE